ncbi:hypothetical protein WOLCODRAFT_108258 [Wolfiporia cocos MD-104 SS10]|uniref:Uncharacterized protein n=1 Tax=Wolfiporia cocos (strain MD-104) TaxID=742152 RepID=A0A2H3J1K1_WOLCO|nr:hypothetical protein WOLCODRAFT_108258 [Wolfiporia cocos MD-104 SS10]
MLSTPTLSQLGNGKVNIRFPNVGLQILSTMIHLLGVSILAALISRRVKSDLLTLKGLSRISFPRWLVLLTLVDSWAFLFTAGVLIQGAGLRLNSAVCSLGIFNCIAFYASSKVLIYLFLVEKIHVVWSPSSRYRRFKSPIYIVCFVVVCLYGVIAVVLIVERISFYREDGTCVIGLKRPASIALLVYDLSVNVIFTSLFLYPLYRSTFRSARVREVAKRTTWAAAVALTTSCVNILVLTLMKGEQLGWVCLGSCGTDVVVNAIALFWVTAGRSESRPAQAPQEVPTAGGRAPAKRSGALPKADPEAKMASTRRASTTLHPTVATEPEAVSGASDVPTVESLDSYEYAYSDDSDVEGQRTWDDEEAEKEVIVEEEHARPSSPQRDGNVFTTLTSIFNRGNEQSRSQDFQITVTTETDVHLDEINAECQPRRRS